MELTKSLGKLKLYGLGRPTTEGKGRKNASAGTAGKEERKTIALFAAAFVVVLGSLRLDLRMTLTAEGVETPEQLRILRDFGCHQIQGYLFSGPLSAGQFTLYLASHRQVAAAAG